MAQILKFPGPATKLGYRRVKKGAAAAPDANQLDLFPPQGAQVLSFAPDLKPFEQALLFDERGDLRAAELYEKAIAEQDCVADAYCNLGILESQKGNTTKAFDCFTTSLQHNPRHSEAHYNLGNLYFDVNDFRLAQIHYEMAAEIDPAFANVYFNLALIQLVNNDLVAAIGALARYQEMVSPDEARHADELLESLRKSLAAARRSRFTAT
jgi:tetratricopeptide (TPR) repeat protein